MAATVFRVRAADGGGALRASSPGAADRPPRGDPASFQFLATTFPILGPHYFGEFAARFGGGRGHQGQDIFAACGRRWWRRAAAWSSSSSTTRAGYYLVIDGERTGIDYTYMHLRDAALVNSGPRPHRPADRLRRPDPGAPAEPPALRDVERAGLVRRRLAVRPAAVPAGLGQDLLTGSLRLVWQERCSPQWAALRRTWLPRIPHLRRVLRRALVAAARPSMRCSPLPRGRPLRRPSRAPRLSPPAARGRRRAAPAGSRTRSP